MTVQGLEASQPSLNIIFSSRCTLSDAHKVRHYGFEIMNFAA